MYFKNRKTIAFALGNKQNAQLVFLTFLVLVYVTIKNNFLPIFQSLFWTNFCSVLISCFVIRTQNKIITSCDIIYYCKLQTFFLKCRLWQTKDIGVVRRCLRIRVLGLLCLALLLCKVNANFEMLQFCLFSRTIHIFS